MSSGISPKPFSLLTSSPNAPVASSRFSWNFAASQSSRCAFLRNSARAGSESRAPANSKSRKESSRILRRARLIRISPLSTRSCNKDMRAKSPSCCPNSEIQTAHQRQRRRMRRPPIRRAANRMQMIDLRPRRETALFRRLDRRDRVGPSRRLRRFANRRRRRPHPRARGIDSRRRMRGRDARKIGQIGEIQKRIRARGRDGGRRQNYGDGAESMSASTP